MESTLYPHQVSALEQVERLCEADRRPMLQAPTAFGKTVLAAALVEKAVADGKRVAFCVPFLELIDQTVTAFWNEGICDVGVMQGSHHMTDAAKPIQICSAQTLRNRQLPHADLVIFDEAHRRMKVYERWISNPANGEKFVGMSATPWTKGLGQLYTDLITAATTKELIEQGYLSKFRVFAPSSPDLSKVRTTAGDWNEGDLSKVAREQDALTADVVATWLQRAQQRSTICFAVDRAHAKQLADRFAFAGVPTAYMDALTSKLEREQTRLKFQHGLLKVVVNVGVLTTGIDWDIRCIILARPTKSEILFTQMIGRGLRTAEGKDHCLILDHSDTHLRLGFVTDIAHATLDDGKLRKKGQNGKHEEFLPKPCKKCGALRQPGKPCDACGFKPERQCLVEETNGQLVELFPGFARLKPKARNKWTPPADKAKFFGELKAYAMERGYKNGWAAHKYREVFDVWPNAFDGVAPVTPSPETRRWIKSRQIAWAHRRVEK